MNENTEDLPDFFNLEPFLKTEFTGEFMTNQPKQKTWMGMPSLDGNFVEIQCFLKDFDKNNIELVLNEPYTNVKPMTIQKVAGDFTQYTFKVAIQNQSQFEFSCSNALNPVKIKQLKQWVPWEPCEKVQEKVSRTNNLGEKQDKYCKCSDLEEMPRPKILILGLKSVGKSSFANQLLGGRAHFKVNHNENPIANEISWRSDHLFGRDVAI